ncbi:MAG: pyridoxal phosphate-dependent aminotransferase family protein [Bacteroidia bacterium]|nr:pyridoxal phosphate-dependent aminotransferase family protein [Bacteroidia bacterium]MDW8236699.1 pyridoxal phosphate-dependent aminotransferase family protein [Bacteroidia bacterium]
MSLQERVLTQLEKLPPRPFYAATEPDFTSNDYLSLVRDGVIAQLWRSLPSTLYRGSTGSRYLGGDDPAYSALEASLLSLWGQPAEQALFFPSGFIANLTFWGVVPQRGDTVIFDREVHASIRHGLRWSGATCWGFPHNHWEEAEKLLRQARGETFLVVESLYSMRGTHPPADAINYLMQKYAPYLVVDEAHTTLLYPNSWSLSQGLKPFARLFTFGKAVGVVGAAWLAPTWLIEYLRRKGFPNIYTTALPPVIPRLITEVLRRSEQWEERRKSLFQLIGETAAWMREHNITFWGLEGPIALLPAEGKALPLKKLYPPTVAVPAYRLSLHAHNTIEEVKGLWGNGAVGC